MNDPLLFLFPRLAEAHAAALPILLLYYAAVGACLGSFLNVCVYRIPLGLSVLRPPSSCAACGRPIPIRYNIPIFGWLWLRGQSACCRTPIDARYFWVELLSALVLPALFLRYAWPEALAYGFFFFLLAAASLIDLDHFLIPDRISWGGMAAGVALGALLPSLHGEASALGGFNAALRGAFWGGAVLWLVVLAGAKAFKKEAMGLGDVKFLAAIGAFLGWRSVFFVVAVSSILGSLYGLLMLLRRRSIWGTRIPYGPFLALAAALWLFGGKELATALWRGWTVR
ncbi:MAG: prepilin peptidase [Verrucomicrobium sp.]|nr:prepilin peptidase [Verrucomicrobium sp.]